MKEILINVSVGLAWFVLAFAGPLVLLWYHPLITAVSITVLVMLPLAWIAGDMWRTSDLWRAIKWSFSRQRGQR